MKETRFFYVPNASTATELPHEEAMHVMRVLRLKAGDEIMLMDGVGGFYRATITLTHTHHCKYEILESLPQEPQWQGHVHLAIAPTKMMERIEWLTEKATEVGIDELSFLNCQFSERRLVKCERIDKIAISATKQSHKAWKPIINEITSFESFIKTHSEGRRYIAHCYEEVPRTNLFDELRKPSNTLDALVLVGPEGDFSIREVQLAVEAGFVSVDLGKSRLRTETAGLAAVMMMHLAKT
jgi:16S rRNA (uracil1498-N3)-methyltransferase